MPFSGNWFPVCLHIKSYNLSLFWSRFYIIHKFGGTWKLILSSWLSLTSLSVQFSHSVTWWQLDFLFIPSLKPFGRNNMAATDSLTAVWASSNGRWPHCYFLVGCHQHLTFLWMGPWNNSMGLSSSSLTGNFISYICLLSHPSLICHFLMLVATGSFSP